MNEQQAMEIAKVEMAESLVSAKMRKKAGFSIAEVLLAITIIGGALGSFIPVGIMSLRELKMGTDYYAASLIARNQIERLRTMDFDAAADAQELSHRVDEYGNSDAHGQFSRNTTVSYVNTNLVQVIVEIRFPGLKGNLSAEPYVMATELSRALQ